MTMLDPLPTGVSKGTPKGPHTALHVSLSLLWLVVLMGGCAVSVDFCDIGAQLGSESGDEWSDAGFQSCTAAVHDRRLVVLVVLGFLAVFTVILLVLVGRASPAGWYLNPVQPGPELRYWNGRVWTGHFAARTASSDDPPDTSGHVSGEPDQ